MPGVARVIADSAQGPILGPGAPTVFVNNQPASVINDAVTPHGNAPHSSPVMVQASRTVYADGKPVCREGDAASCGHVATGSRSVFAD